MILDPQWRPTVVVMEMVRPEESVAVMLDVPLSNSSATLYAKSKLPFLAVGNIETVPTWAVYSSRALWSRPHRSSLPYL